MIRLYDVLLVLLTEKFDRNLASSCDGPVASIAWRAEPG